MTLGSSGFKGRFYLLLLVLLCSAAAARIYMVFRSPQESREPAKTAAVAKSQKRELPPGYLERDASPPRIDGLYPCVYVSMSDAQPAPNIGKCGMSSLLFSQPVDRFEVDLRYGKFMLRQTDLFLEDGFPVPFTRTYNSSDWLHPNPVHAFGRNANHTYDIAPLGTRRPYTWQLIDLEDGNFVYFDRLSPGGSYGNAVFRHSETSTFFYKAFTYWNLDGWTTRLADGTEIFFPESYNAKKIADGAPTEVVRPDGQKLLLRRNAERNLQEIRTPHDHFITLSYNDQGLIRRAEDDDGHWATYLYNAEGMLISVMNSSGKERRYEYDGDRMTGIRDEQGNLLLQNTYLNGFLRAQQFADGEVYEYGYNGSASGQYAESAFVHRADGTTREIQTGDSVPNHIKELPP
jgi:YD repeat-containing protein